MTRTGTDDPAVLVAAVFAAGITQIRDVDAYVARGA
jgi:hypothetical protein